VRDFAIPGLAARLPDRGIVPDRFSTIAEYGLTCGFIFAVGLFLVSVTPASTIRASDFSYFYIVSKMVLAGHGGDIYNLAVLGHVERAWVYPQQIPDGVLPNNYSPFFAVAFVPFAALPYSLAYAIWLALNSVFLGSCLVALGRLAGLGIRGKAVLAVAAALSVPAIVAMVLGQVSFFLLLLLIGCLLALRGRRDILAGSLLALTLFKPQYVVPFLLLLVMLRRRRALAGFITTTACLTIAPLPILGLDADLRYVRALIAAVGYPPSIGGFGPRLNSSFAGFAQLLLDPSAARVVAIVLSLAALGVLVLTIRRGASLEVAFAQAMVVALLTSQHVLIHDLSLLLIPATVLIRLRSAGSIVLLGLTYVVVPIGYRLAIMVPLQLTTLLLCVLLGYFYLCSQASIPESKQSTEVSAA